MGPEYQKPLSKNHYQRYIRIFLAEAQPVMDMSGDGLELGLAIVKQHGVQLGGEGDVKNRHEGVNSLVITGGAICH